MHFLTVFISIFDCWRLLFPKKYGKRLQGAVLTGAEEPAAGEAAGAEPATEADGAEARSEKSFV